jgi:hypothetical protein
MIRLLLVDYGEVISTPLPEDTITDLAALADQPRAIFLDRYFPGHGGTLQRDRHRGVRPVLAADRGRLLARRRYSRR